MSRPSVLSGPISSHPPPTHRSLHQKSSPYSPSSTELHPGPRNRLFLALRSGIASEVDWALPRLVVASFDSPEHFRLESWVDAVGALQGYPDKWITHLEQVAAIRQIRNGEEDAPDNVKAVVPEWTVDPDLERRATECLQVLRNASFIGSNPKVIVRAPFMTFLERFFALPIDFLVEVSVTYPEAVSNILVTLTSILPHIKHTPTVLGIFAEVLPRLLVETRDNAILTLLIPILISTSTIAILPPLPEELVPHLMKLLTLHPPSPLLDLILDLLVSLSANTLFARQILASPSIPVYLRSLVPLLSYGAKPFTAKWESTPALAGRLVRNPASTSGQAEEASRRREIEREMAQRAMEMGQIVDTPVGDRPPTLAPAIMERLFTMPEPERSIRWMHEMFVYNTHSQLLQVTFWNAYRDFFTNESTVSQLLSASEVIKNVTIAFPGASAKIWDDPSDGKRKFVIAGMGFRRGGDDDDRFTCRWRTCPGSRLGSPAELYAHVSNTHVGLAPPPNCAWGSCQSAYTPSHILTHIPTIDRPNVPETMTLHPTIPDRFAYAPRLSDFPPAPLPRAAKLAYTGIVTPSDERRTPIGPSFLAALIIRNLARGLRAEIILDAPEERTEEKKKHLLEERYGLPIPESVLREEEEEERDAEKEVEDVLSTQERERAISAFVGVEERLLEVMEANLAGLGEYLSGAVGW